MKSDQNLTKTIIFGSLLFALNTACAQLSAVLELNELDGNNGFLISGTNSHDLLGYSVSIVGDINADGIDDFAIGATESEMMNNNGPGSVYVIFGTTSDLPATFNVVDLDGSNGFVVRGIADRDRVGYTVNSVGDVNNDGIDDLIMGVPDADPFAKEFAGSSYVIYGSDTGFPAELSLKNINGWNGFIINGANAGDYSGVSVSSAGDINGDGKNDLIVGARLAEPEPLDNLDLRGITYVIYGSDIGFPNPINLSTIDGNNGFMIVGADSGDQSGISVSNAGDVNADGLEDIVIGSWFADPMNQTEAGRAYIIFGNELGFPLTLDLSDIDGGNGYVINGLNSFDFFGISVSNAGDINADGIDDLVIGAPGADPMGLDSAGSSYVVFGSLAIIDTPLNLNALNGSNGFVINGESSNDSSGLKVSHAGDVNGDGIDDMIIGAASADFIDFDNAGKSYVIFGRSGGFSDKLNVADLDGTNGAAVVGDTNFTSGFSVGGAGDVNGDGLSDIIIGAVGIDAGAGGAFVVYGDDVIFVEGFD